MKKKKEEEETAEVNQVKFIKFDENLDLIIRKEEREQKKKASC